MDNPRLLLVDDRVDVRLTTAAILEDAGYDVVEAGSLEEARGLLDGKSLAAAIVDVHLGDGSGLELVPVLRDRHPAAAVLLFTGSGAGHELGGADALLSKGMSPEEMIERVRTLVAARRA